MVFTVETNIKSDFSGFKELAKQLAEAQKQVAIVGVINADADATENAVLNEFGGVGIYKDGPYAGQSVQVPQRSFIQAPIELGKEEIVAAAENEIKELDLDSAIKKMAEKAVELQEYALESNGEGIPGWQKHSGPRTIETKGGMDQPLYTRHGTTFPIDYEIQRRGA